MDNAEIVNQVTGNTLNLNPTEKNKPSPHSSLTFSQMMIRLDAAFPASEGFKTVLIANTNSMEPLFDSNCVVVLETLSAEALLDQPLTTGDVIVYPSSNGNIIHMLELHTSQGWVLKGVNNKVEDMSYVPDSVIKWRVCAIGYCRQVITGD